MTTTRVHKDDRKKYLHDHLPYRLNSLRAWDIFEYRKRNRKISKEVKDCYEDSPVVDPAFEIAIVFGRSLLHFLGLTCNNGKLDYYVSQKKDDVQVWDVIPGKQPYPLEKISSEEKKYLCNLIKVANKSGAHLTTKTSTKELLDSLEPAREIIYRITLEHVDGLKKEKIWWEKDK